MTDPMDEPEVMPVVDDPAVDADDALTAGDAAVPTPMVETDAVPAVATAAVLPMTEALRAELPRMLDEHQAIHAATRRLGEVARKAGNAEVQQLAEALALHAQSEEEVFYPAALLVGEVVESRSQAHGS